MKMNIFKTLTGILAIMIVAMACSTKAADNKSEAGVAVASSLPVDVKIAKETELAETEAVAGSVVSNRTVGIMSELPKKITAVLFKDGGYVSQGQVLYRHLTMQISTQNSGNSAQNLTLPASMNIA